MDATLPTLRIRRQGRMTGRALNLFERALVQAYRMGNARMVFLLLGRRLRKGLPQGSHGGT